jgi:hypothetical protein
MKNLVDQVRALMQPVLLSEHDGGYNAAIRDVLELIDRPADEPSDDWRPIATAPKDGMHILAYFDHDPVYRSDDPSDRMAVVRWSGEYTGWSMPGIGGLSPVLWKPLVRPALNRRAPHE